MIKLALQDDAFIADVRTAAAARRDGDKGFEFWWLGQSGFLIHWAGRFILVDPYLSDSLTEKYAATDKPHVRVSERVLDPGRLDFLGLVTSSHNHTDHLDARSLLPLFDANPELELIIPEANRQFVAERLGVDPNLPIGLNDDGPGIQICGIQVVAVPAAHPTLERDERGLSRYLGYVFRRAGLSIYHSGDTMPHDDIVERLSQFPDKIDIAILPINGKVGNMSGREAAQFAKDIGAKLVIPCHYDMFEFNTADPADEFIPECERLNQAYRVLQQGERFSSEEIPK